MKWKAHTSTDAFADTFAEIMEEYDMENDERAMKIEEYMMAEAKKIGVVKMGTVRGYKNPNRWEKQLAPWFSEECRDKRN